MLRGHLDLAGAAVDHDAVERRAVGLLQRDGVYAPAGACCRPRASSGTCRVFSLYSHFTSSASSNTQPDMAVRPKPFTAFFSSASPILGCWRVTGSVTGLFLPETARRLYAFSSAGEDLRRVDALVRLALDRDGLAVHELDHAVRGAPSPPPGLSAPAATRESADSILALSTFTAGSAVAAAPKREPMTETGL